MKGKLSAVLLAFAMIFSLVPDSALAFVEDDVAAIQDAGDAVIQGMEVVYIKG